MTTAKFSQSRNDMYWTHYDSEDQMIRWTGYDDSFWWSNVATDEKFTDKIGLSSGRRYRLDPTTDTVSILP